VDNHILYKGMFTVFSPHMQSKMKLDLITWSFKFAQLA